MKRVRITASVYFIFQSAAVFGWWMVMSFFPKTVEYFRLDPTTIASLYAFWPGDVFFIGPGSLVAGILIARRNRFAEPLMWLVTGGIGFATFYTFAFVRQTDTGWLGFALMLPALLWSGLFSAVLRVGNDMFAKSRPATNARIITKTSIQILVIWSVVLVVIPYLLTILEAKLGIAPYHFPYQRYIAGALFILLSLIGFWSAYVMSTVGKGTPLPLDHSRNLVFKGPYAYVRNPMALSGIGQGLAVALFFGSPLAVIYALMGSAIWQFVLRPLEEEDLSERFGDEYERYRVAVRCWIPEARAYERYVSDASSNSADVPSGRM